MRQFDEVKATLTALVVELSFERREGRHGGVGEHHVEEDDETRYVPVSGVPYRFIIPGFSLRVCGGPTSPPPSSNPRRCSLTRDGDLVHPGDKLS